MTDREQRQKWMNSKSDEVMTQCEPENLLILPSDMQLAIQGLLRQAFERGYNWGYNDGRSSIGSGREPSYAVSPPAQIEVFKPHTAA